MKTLTMTAALLGCLSVVLPAAAQDKLRPFVLAYEGPGEIAAKAGEVKGALQKAGFSVVGEHAPYDGAHLIVVTSDDLRTAAAKSTNGGFGAGQRIGIAKNGDKLQVAYANPAYWAAAFRMNGNMAPVAAKLATALGALRPFGSEQGLTDKDLRGYHYMVFMPYFDDVNTIGSADSHQDMLAKVEAGLAQGKGGARKVYRIDIPGKEETVFGVALESGPGADRAVMSVVDLADIRHTAHLPYDLLVAGNQAYALDGKFRIAISFPDLTMGTFMRINDAPDGIRDALMAAAGRGR